MGRVGWGDLVMRRVVSVGELVLGRMDCNPVHIVLEEAAALASSNNTRLNSNRPSCLWVNVTGAAHGDVDIWIKPTLIISLTTFLFERGVQWALCLMG